MECFTCKEKMKCIDDINTDIVRIDLMECPKCASKAEIHYGENGKYVKKVIWNR